MNWSFAIGLGTSVIGIGTLVALWNQWRATSFYKNYYKTRYHLRDKQLDSTLTEWEKLNKNHTMLLETCSGLLTENIQHSEKLGELGIELSMANGRVEQMTNLFLAEQKRADDLQKEIDEIFKPENY